MTVSTLLPGSSYPRPDEVLSSWVSRLALNHGLSPSSFWKILVLPSIATEIQDRFDYTDVDRYTSPVVLSLLAERTETPLERARQTTLYDYEPFRKDSLRGERTQLYSSSFSWWLPFGNSKTRGIGPSYCSSCLRKDGTRPYFRKQWRFSCAVACLDCGTLLMNGCPRCQVSVDYRKLNRRISNNTTIDDLAINLAICRHCGCDLAQTPAKRASLSVLELQRKLQVTWQQTRLLPRRTTGSYFDWLEYIVESLVVFNRYRPADFPVHSLHIQDSRIKQLGNRFGEWPTDLRAYLLSQAVMIIGDNLHAIANEKHGSKIRKPLPHHFYTETHIYVLLSILMEFMPTDWMVNWSAFAPDANHNDL